MATTDRVPDLPEMIAQAELTPKMRRKIQMDDWLSKNALPKKIKLPRKKKRKPRRFQKAGPMNDEAWMQFYNWYKRHQSIRKKRLARRLKKSKKALPTRQVKPIGYLMRRIRKLQVPKMPRPKFYRYVREPVFIPKILFKPRPVLEKHRPFPEFDIPVKYSFPHDEVEYLWWHLLRFPVHPNALNYKPSAKILELAKPKTYPIKPHCPLPIEAAEYILQSRKMSYRQWREHLRYLQYFAAPKPDFTPDFYIRRIRVPLYRLKPRIQILSEPRAPRARKCIDQPPENLSTVSKAALSANASSRTESLAKSRHKGVKCKDRPPEKDGVKKGALSASPSGRTTELAKPKKDHSLLSAPRARKSRRKIRPSKCDAFSLGAGPPPEEEE